MISLFISLVIVALLVILAFWRNERMLFYLAAFGLIAFGFAYYTTISYYSILIVLLGGYCFARGIWAT